MNQNKLVVIKTTSLSVKEVIDKLEKIIQEKGVKIFARINYAQGASDVGLTMPEQELLIFGNPKVGTSLMLENPVIGIELPLKILAWRSEQKTMLASYDLDQLAELFNLKTSLDKVALLKNFMENLMQAVAA